MSKSGYDELAELLGLTEAEAEQERAKPDQTITQRTDPQESSPRPEKKRKTSASGIVYRSLSDVEPQDVPWLWEDRLPRGMLTLLAGDPGLGKSYIALDLASRISTGRAWPHGEPDPPVGNTILLSSEEVPEYIIRPRLDRLKGDPSRIVTLEAVATIKAGSSAPQGNKYFSHDGPPFVRVSDLSVYGRTASLNDSADQLSPVALSELPLVKVP